MARKWSKGEVPDDGIARIELAVGRMRAVAETLSPNDKSRAYEIMNEWTRVNGLALALGIKLTKHDYRDFMLRKLAVK